LLDIVRPRTRCERSKLSVGQRGRIDPLAAGQSRQAETPLLCAPSSPTVCPLQSSSGRIEGNLHARVLSCCYC
jgi:hypothetical protein